VNTINVRFSDGMFFASMEDSELEGSGESISDALRDLAEVIDTSTI
jgi:hypothetical protein